MKRIFQIKKILDKAIEAVLGFLILIMCLVVLWQVFTRFVLQNPSSWSEEVCRYLLIWATLIGGALGLNNGTHMGLTLVTDRIKSLAVKALFHIVAYCVCGAIGYIFIKYGYIYAMSGMARTMMCCDFPMGYIYMMVPVCGVIIIINCIENVLTDICTIRSECVRTDR